jgi:hypothetical protein
MLAQSFLRRIGGYRFVIERTIAHSETYVDYFRTNSDSDYSATRNFPAAAKGLEAWIPDHLAGLTIVGHDQGKGLSHRQPNDEQVRAVWRTPHKSTYTDPCIVGLGLLVCPGVIEETGSTWRALPFLLNAAKTEVGPRVDFGNHRLEFI